MFGLSKTALPQEAKKKKVGTGENEQIVG